MTDLQAAIEDARILALKTRRDHVVLDTGRRLYVRDRQKNIPAGAWLICLAIPERFDAGATTFFPKK